MTTSCCMASELAVGGGAELDLVDGGGTRADGAEHLLALEHELDGLADDLGGHGGERHVRPHGALGAEAAAGVGALDVDVVEGNVEEAWRCDCLSPEMYWVAS